MVGVVDPRVREAVDRLTDAQVFETLRLAQLAWPRIPTAAEIAEACGRAPDPWQRQLYETDANRVILNCSRRSGKSTSAAILALRYALAHPDAVVLFAAGQNIDQAQETLVRAKLAFRLAMLEERVERDSDRRFVLGNGSRLLCVAATASSVRGYDGDFVVVDEAAYAEEDFFEALFPILATNPGARIILLSTPHTRRGQFWSIWEQAPAWEEGIPAADQPYAWLKVEVPWQLCPRIPEEFVANERRERGPLYVAREFECQFSDEDFAAYPPEQVEAILQPGIGQWRVF